jgi:diguanylate cyclase (GGDEF)-like protein
VIIGNGIRFGLNYLFFAMAIGCSGFFLLITFSSYWQSQPILSYGLLLGCIILPLFFISIIKRLHQQNEQLETTVNIRTKELVQAERELSLHNDELEILVISRTKELEDNVELLIERSVELQAEIATRTEVEARLKHSAFHDSLTNLPNRAWLYDEAERVLTDAKDNSVMVAILFIDIDDFKKINDGYGHGVGDSVLVELANRIIDCVRDNDTVSRIGGDEFVVLLSQCRSIDEINSVAEVILKSLSEPIHEVNINQVTGSSIGISIYPDNSLNWLDLLKKADEAMYISKNDGKNKVSYSV